MISVLKNADPGGGNLLLPNCAVSRQNPYKTADIEAICIFKKLQKPTLSYAGWFSRMVLHLLKVSLIIENLSVMSPTCVVSPNYAVP